MTHWNEGYAANTDLPKTVCNKNLRIIFSESEHKSNLIAEDRVGVGNHLSISVYVKYVASECHSCIVSLELPTTPVSKTHDPQP